MPTPNIEIVQELEGKTSRPLEWQQVLFLQIDRILKAWTEFSGDFISGVEALDSAMAYFKEKDRVFKKELDEIDKKAREELNRSRTYGGRIPQDDMQAISYARSKLKLEALLRLMGRSGFYPEQQAPWIEPK